MSPHPSSSSASSRAHDDDTAAHPPPPPPKRVRREYPWRPEYEREFGVRPIQVDAATGDAVLVECRFCVSFGREAPVAPVTPPVNKAGQPIKSRARTRNVAHWKYPFRTDNMRSHHLQQHAHKWTEYTTLLEHSKQHPHASGSDATDGGEQRASLRLSSFFGESQEIGVTTPAGAAVVPVADTALPAAISATSSTGGAPSSAAMNMLVSLITNTAIVDAVLPLFVDVPTSDADLSSPEASTWLRPVRSSRSGIDEDSSVTQYSIESNIATRGMVRLLAAGLSFRQVAEVAPSLRASDAATVTRGDVVAFARALVASSLERIAQLVAVVWTYSIRLSVDAPSSDTSPAPLRVCLRVPVDESREIEDFHVVTIALHQTSEAKVNVAALIRAILSAVDRHWEKKASSVVIDGATHCLGVHADLVERVVRPLLTEPVLSIRDGRQDVEHAVQTAWAQYRRDEDDSAVFTGTLLQLVGRVRAETEIVRAHHHCPLVQLHDALSVLRTLKWLLARREALADNDIDAPMRWWLIAHVIVDLWSDCLATFADKGTGQSRDAVELLVKTLMEKCGVTTSKTNDKARHTNESPDNVEFDEATRAASLRVDATSSRLSWTTRDIAQCLRTLNVSTRRMFADVSKDAVLLRTAERQAARFVLLLLGQLTPLASASSQKKTLPKQLPPPTRPLDFGAMEAADVVDFVEKHSHRLELAFPTMFLDLASREIRELQTLLATDEQLRAELEQVAKHPRMPSQLSAFAAAWVLVPQFPAAQTLAAGLATAIPGQRTNAEGLVVAFSRAENGLVPPGVMVDLAVEACAHAQQLERLQDAAAESPCDDSLVVIIDVFLTDPKECWRQLPATQPWEKRSRQQAFSLDGRTARPRRLSVSLGTTAATVLAWGCALAWVSVCAWLTHSPERRRSLLGACATSMASGGDSAASAASPRKKVTSENAPPTPSRLTRGALKKISANSTTEATEQVLLHEYTEFQHGLPEPKAKRRRIGSSTSESTAENEQETTVEENVRDAREERKMAVGETPAKAAVPPSHNGPNEPAGGTVDTKMAVVDEIALVLEEKTNEPNDTNDQAVGAGETKAPVVVAEIELAQDEKKLDGAPEGELFVVTVLLSSEITASSDVDAEISVVEEVLAAKAAAAGEDATGETKDESHLTWGKEYAALDSLRRLAIHHRERLTALLDATENRIVSQLVCPLAMNLRSAMVRNALLCIQDIIVATKHDGERLYGDIIPVLLQRAGNEKQFIRDLARDVLMTCVETNPSEVLLAEFLRTSTSEKNAQIVSTAGLYTQKCIGRMDKTKLKTFVLTTHDNFMEEMSAFLNCKVVECKAATRRTLQYLRKHIGDSEFKTLATTKLEGTARFELLKASEEKKAAAAKSGLPKLSIRERMMQMKEQASKGDGTATDEVVVLVPNATR